MSPKYKWLGYKMSPAVKLIAQEEDFTSTVKIWLIDGKSVRRFTTYHLPDFI